MLSKKKEFTKISLICATILAILFVPGCRKKAREEKRKRRTNYQIIKETKDSLLARGKKEDAIKKLEKMIPLCNNIQELKGITLEIADLLFETGSIGKAEELFKRFSNLYPGDAKVEYALYKATLCSFWQTLDMERDQSKTKNTISLAKKFLDRKEVFTQYIDEVGKMMVDCQQRLFDSEVSVFRFYLKRNDYISANHRLAAIEKEFTDKIPDLDAQIIMLTCELAEKINNKELLEQKQKELKEKYPETQKAITLAKAEKPKNSYVDKF